MEEDKLVLTDKQKERFSSASSMIGNASDELRNISHAIMPASLANLGLPAALKNVIAGLAEVSGINFIFNASDFEERPEEEIELSIYYIAMELINNIVKHSGASEATVQLIRHPGLINLTVEDNGKGFDLRKLKQEKGIGLANIRSRVAFLEGKIEIDSTPGHGASILIDIPVKRVQL